MYTNYLLDTKMVQSLQLAKPVDITSAAGVLTLTVDSNSFVAGGDEAITAIIGGADMDQGIYVITWNTVRTLKYDAAKLQLIGKADRTTKIGDVGFYQLNGDMVTELAFTPVGGYAENAYSTVLVDGTKVNADSPAATLELIAGTNIALTADADKRSVTIAVTGKVADAAHADVADSVAWDTVTGKPATFPPPVATTEILGGIKQGNGLIIAADGTASVNVKYLVPSGVIVMWSGMLDAVPLGWLLCDGTNGTPDLRNRFIVGAGNSYPVNVIGGEAQHTLTIEEIPRHNHREIGSGIITGNHVYRGGGGQVDWSDDYTCETGGGAAHNNLPPYYALAFIIKI